MARKKQESYTVRPHFFLAEKLVQLAGKIAPKQLKLAVKC